MVLWQGITEGGTAVPVQVTEAGKVVAEGQKGDTGPEGPIGPKGPPGEYGPGDDVDLGNIEAAGTVTASYTGDVISPNPTGIGCTMQPGGELYLSRNPANSGVVYIYKTGEAGAKITLSNNGNVNAAGTTNIGPFAIGDATGSGHHLVPGGLYYVQRPGTSPNEPVYSVYKGTDETLTIDCGGSIAAADNQAGITPSGELYFTSRGTRYKLVVAGGLVNAEPFTREMELRERVEEKRKPRPTDSVPED